jgi:glycolate oxidase iron-sulfur subunit
VLEGNETNSPRGRIYLMKMGKAGEVPMDQEFVDNFDACLGCMACVTACPSGVKYDQLIEAVRPQIERGWERTRADRAFRWMIFTLFPYPARLRPAAFFGTLYQRLGVRRLLAATGLLARLPARLRAMEALLPDLSLGSVVARQPAFTPAVGTSRHRVGLLSGCVQRVFFGDVNAAATRVLAAEGCDVVAPKAQQCCGALSSHAGREEEAAERARHLIDVFEAADVQSVVVNVAGCGSSMKEYALLLRDDPAYAERAVAFSAKVRDISELLDELGPIAPRHPIPARIAYHDACHLAHAQGIRAQPRAVLRGIPELTVMDIPEADICCGSAGHLQPGAARAGRGARPPQGRPHQLDPAGRRRHLERRLPAADPPLPRRRGAAVPPRAAGRRVDPRRRPDRRRPPQLTAVRILVAPDKFKGSLHRRAGRRGHRRGAAPGLPGRRGRAAAGRRRRRRHRRRGGDVPATSGGRPGCRDRPASPSRRPTPCAATLRCSSWPRPPGCAGCPAASTRR